MGYYVGLDIGGTFTDCAVLDERGQVATTAKSASVPRDPGQGVLGALEVAAANLGLPLDRFLAETSLVIHGCTVGTNAMIERKGARVGLITTRGHEDCLFIGKVNQKVAGLSEREIVHQRALDKAEPIVDPALIRGVSERIDSQGDVVCQLNEAEAEKAIAELAARGAQSLAVCFLWSFLNPSHEARLREMVAQRHPGTYVCTSADVAPVLGEYERMVTTTLSAYLRPRVVEYLERLEGRLRELGYSQRLLLSHCMGGLTTVDEVRTKPLLTLDSGPAGGVLGLQFFSRQYGEPNIIGTDMGGTSFDVALIEKGEAALEDEPVIDKYVFLVPKLATQSIGAGGGSIIWVDPDGILRVGPQSAGADPGPACYDTGGTQPAVSDADLVLGYLNPEHFLGGRKRLDRAKAEAALEGVAKALGMSTVEAAAGAFKIVNSHMADLVRRATIERGYDPRDFALFSFGGAGPTHVCSFGRELQVKGIYIPRHATVFCALGMLTGGILHSYEMSYPAGLPMAARDLGAVNDIYGRIESRLREQFQQEGLDPAQARVTRFAYMKYRLQPRTLLVPTPDGRLSTAGQQALADAFESRYAGIYGPGSGYRQAGIEAIKYRVDGFIPSIVPAVLPERAKGEADPSEALKSSRPAYFEEAGGFTDTRVYDGDLLRYGHRLEGPCIVERMGDTLVIPPGVQAQVDEFQNLRIGSFGSPAR
ncbi:MAG: hydantoinase/oxoprolinase family protein [Chloroflexi bacterium]|nr:hydantoinase/oxoprolinase family protein [Chloroflexota bacterium]